MRIKIGASGWYSGHFCVYTQIINKYNFGDFNLKIIESSYLLDVDIPNEGYNRIKDHKSFESLTSNILNQYTNKYINKKSVNLE